MVQRQVFTCDEPECGRTYARREHLTRHQLNRKLMRRHLAELTHAQIMQSRNIGAGPAPGRSSGAIFLEDIRCGTVISLTGVAVAIT